MSLRKAESRAGYLFAAPWIVGVLLFMLYPLGASFYYSFTDYSILNPPVWIGTDNYTALMRDELFWTTLKNTFIFAAIFLPLSLIVSLGLAMLLNMKVKGLAFYRTAFYIPSIVPMIPLAILWLWLFNGEYGLVNQALGAIGINGPDWLNGPLWTKPGLSIIAVWGSGNAMVIYLAGLGNVPQHLYEAADLDGATPWHRTRFVTLPMISPVILFNVILGIIASLQVFAVPYVMFPNGKPGYATYFYTMYLYDNFLQQRMGYASAMGWIMFVLIFLLTLGALKFADKRVHYGSAA